MNTQVGKSAGIALLMAAALLAALFAMGVFAPAGVEAGIYVAGDKAPTAKLVDANNKEATTATTDQTYSLVVEFEVNDTVDGILSDGTGGNDSVTIDLPNSSAVTGFTIPALATPNVPTVTQGGKAVGTVAITAASSGGADATGDPDVTISTNAASPLEKDKRVTVTFTGVTLTANSVVAPQTVTIKQGTESSGTAKFYVENPNAAPTGASAVLGSVSDTLVVKFTVASTGGTGDIILRMPNDYFLVTAAGGNVSIGDSDNTSTATIAGPVANAATGTRDLTIATLDAGEVITVTITDLSALDTGDEIVLWQESTGYSRTLEVGGASVSPTTGVGGAANTLAVLGTLGIANKADAAAKVVVTGTATVEVPGGRSIVVDMPGFQLPDTIDPDDVIIDGATAPATADTTPPLLSANSYYGHPSSVSISGSKITVTVPTRLNDTARTITGIATGHEYTITFTIGAGIKNPNSAGVKTITIQDADTPASANEKLMVEIISHVTVLRSAQPPKTDWVSRGQEVTVTAKGINASGDATAHLHEAHSADDIAELQAMLNAKRLTGEMLAGLPVVGRDLMDGGTAVITFDAASVIFDAGAVDATGNTAALSAKGTNVIIVVDAGGNVIGYDRLGLTPKVDLEVEDVRRTGRMGVTISDWYYGDVENITVNGIQVQLPDGPDVDDAAEPWEDQSVPSSGKLGPFDVIVPRRARIGEMEVTVYGTTYKKQGTLNSQDKHKQTVNVNAFDLTLNPSTAVTDQVIRIEGTGFGERQCIVSIKVGDENIGEATNGEEIGAVADCVVTDSNGEMSNSFEVPDYLEPGDYPVVVTDAINRVGEAVLTIPEPEIEITPMESQRGDTVVVEGSNFPAEDLITITYSDETVTVATTDTVGDSRATFEVPVDAAIGRDHEVIAKSEKKADGRPDTPGGGGSPSRAGRNPEDHSGYDSLRRTAEHRRRKPAAVHAAQHPHRRHTRCR